MAHWYSPFWDPGITKGPGFKPGGVHGETPVCSSPYEGDLRVPTACQVGFAVVLQNEKN
jgi:hypothetical protein